MKVVGYQELAKELRKQGHALPVRTLRTLTAHRKISLTKLGHRTVQFDVDKVMRELGFYERKSVAALEGLV